MLSILVPKKEYIYVAKYINPDNFADVNYFRFKIITDDNTYEHDLENMTGKKGDAVWETRSNIPFEPEGICYFRGDKFHIKMIDGNRKAVGIQEQAFANVKANGNIPIRLVMRKAGI